MYVTSSNDTERPLMLVKLLEDIPGGGTIEPDDFKTDTEEMSEGALVAVDSNGLYHVVKTAELHADATDSATTYQVEKNHEFKVGDYIGNTGLDAGYAISAINTSNADYDVITVGTTIGVAFTAGDVLVQTTSAGTALAYTPVAIALNTVDLTKDNLGCGLLVRGTVVESLLPYAVDSVIKALLPLIRFV